MMSDKKLSPKKIVLMQRIFGVNEAHHCKECNHLVRHTVNRSFYKCDVYGETASESTDWRLRYTACGMFNKSYDGTPIIEVKKHMPRLKEDYQCEGQICLFDSR